MFRKLKLKILNILLKWTEKLGSSFNREEHLERVAAVRYFLHEILPIIDEKWEGKAIIEGGKYNYFELPDGNLPKYDFTVPEIPLYVIVGDISSADWPQAQLRGLKKETWEKSQSELAFIEKATLELSTIGLAAQPKLIVIKWNDSINHFSLSERFQGCF